MTETLLLVLHLAVFNEVLPPGIVGQSMNIQALAKEKAISEKMFMEEPQLIDVKRVMMEAIRQLSLLRLWLLMLKFVDPKWFAKKFIALLATDS